MLNNFADDDYDRQTKAKKKKKKKKKVAHQANGYAVESPDEHVADNELHLQDQQWNVPAFKPRRDYEVPGGGKQPGTIPNSIDRKAAPPNPTQKANDYLLQRVNDPAYQQYLADNQLKN